MRPFVTLVAFFAFTTLAEASPKLESGPMVGYGTHHEVMIWLRTSEPAFIAVDFWPEDAPGEIRRSRTQRTQGPQGRIAHVQLLELAPGKRYGYRVHLASASGDKPSSPFTEIKVDYPLRFRTQTLWKRRGNPADFTLALGSCAYANDPDFEPKAVPYGGGYEIFESIRARKPDFMLWLGDNVYFRETDWSSPQGMLRRYSRSRQIKELQPFLGSVHHYAIWDDHDFGPNDSDRSFVHKGQALDAFQSYWANPSYGLPELPGVFGKFTWEDVDFFLVDNRYYRAPSNAPKDRTKTMLGPGQFGWLIDALTSSKAPFKVVVGGGQFLSPFDHFEGYAQHPVEQKKLIDTIVERKISGVVFLSGDRHHSELVKLAPEGFYPLYDFTSSPLTSRGANADRERDSAVRVPGTLVTGQRNFGLIHVRGPLAERVMVLETRDTSGRLLWTHSIRAQDISVPKDKKP